MAQVRGVLEGDVDSLRAVSDDDSGEARENHVYQLQESARGQA
jgi:hypothetical protein